MFKLTTYLTSKNFCETDAIGVFYVLHIILKQNVSKVFPINSQYFS